MSDEELDAVAGGTLGSKRTFGTTSQGEALVADAVRESRKFLKKALKLTVETADRRQQEDRELG